MKFILAGLIGAVLAGCAPTKTLEQGRQEASSGRVGCPPAEVRITDTGDKTWNAECKGKLYYCTGGPNPACSANQ